VCPALVLALALLGCNGSVQLGEVDDSDGSSGPDAGGVAPSPDAGPPGDPCPRGQGEAAALDVVAAQVSGPGGAPQKGDELTVTLTVRNTGSAATDAVLGVRIDSRRFDRFTGIRLGTSESTLVCPGESTITLRGGPFLASDDGTQHFALGSGDYDIAAVELLYDGQMTTDAELDGKAFSLATNNVLLVPLLYAEAYFEEIEGAWASPEAYAEEAFLRKNEIFTPTGADPDGAGDFVGFEGGYDEMMNVRHKFRSFPGFDGSFDSGENWCYGAMDHASQVLGLPARWGGGGTRDDQHGFDYVIALSAKMGGGVAWSPFDVQVSGFINRDVDRQQVILVHESGHVFGSPHCDDVGNGSGGSLQGYVMCSGEKHERYPESFVWHSTSIEQMSASRWR
jgi:hypothetical protein